MKKEEYMKMQAEVNIARRVAKLSQMQDLRARHDTWPTNHSDFKKYLEHFKDFKAKIEEKLLGTSPVIVDLLSSPTAIRTALSSQAREDARGISISLHDGRAQSKVEQDTQLGITHITHDLGEPKSWNMIKNELGGRKADLIIERGVAGINLLPMHFYYFRLSMREIWKMLSPNGGIFVASIMDDADTRLKGFIDPFVSTQKDQGIKATAVKVPLATVVLLEKNPNSPSLIRFPRVDSN